MITKRNPTQAILSVMRRGIEGKQRKQWEAFSRLFLLALEDAYEDGRTAALEFASECEQAKRHGQVERAQ